MAVVLFRKGWGNHCRGIAGQPYLLPVSFVLTNCLSSENWVRNQDFPLRGWLQPSHHPSCSISSRAPSAGQNLHSDTVQSSPGDGTVLLLHLRKTQTAFMVPVSFEDCIAFKQVEGWVSIFQWGRACHFCWPRVFQRICRIKVLKVFPSQTSGFHTLPIRPSFWM